MPLCGSCSLMLDWTEWDWLVILQGSFRGMLRCSSYHDLTSASAVIYRFSAHMNTHAHTCPCCCCCCWCLFSKDDFLHCYCVVPSEHIPGAAPVECCSGPSIMIFQAQIHFLDCCWFWLWHQWDFHKGSSGADGNPTNRLRREKKTLLEGTTNTSLDLRTHNRGKYVHTRTHTRLEGQTSNDEVFLALTLLVFLLFFSFVWMLPKCARREICWCEFFGISRCFFSSFSLVGDLGLKAHNCCHVRMWVERRAFPHTIIINYRFDGRDHTQMYCWHDPAEITSRLDCWTMLPSELFFELFELLCLNIF